MMSETGDIFIVSGKIVKGPYTFKNIPNIRLQDGRLRQMDDIPEPGESLTDQYPDVADEIVAITDMRYQGLQGKDLKPHISKPAMFECKKCKYRWKTLIRQRTKSGCGCPKCSEDRNQSVFENYIYDKLKTALEYKGYVLQRHVFLRDLVIQSEHNMKSNFDMYIPALKTAIEFNGYFSHNHWGNKRCDEIKEQWCRDNKYSLIVIRTNPTSNEAVERNIVNDITYYDMNDEQYCMRNNIRVVGSKSATELDAIIKDIVESIK